MYRNEAADLKLDVADIDEEYIKKGKKIDIYRYKSKKNERRHIGHRQPYTKLQITTIEA